MCKNLSCVSYLTVCPYIKYQLQREILANTGELLFSVMQNFMYWLASYLLISAWKFSLSS